MADIQQTRGYYADPYTTRFDARVIEVGDVEGRPAIVLDRTFFYPTSGGQPHDLGTLDGRHVIDVAVRDSDAAILHVLDGPVTADRVTATVDWARRYDHMQQHTGQHILSQAFVRHGDATTIGFHLGADYVSIDLDRAPLGDAAEREVFALANDAVRRDLEVRAWFPSAEELSSIQLRKTPDVEGALRVVAVGDFDISACGGTHVSRTGEIGLIHHLRTERLKRGSRVVFLCGDRAKRDYAEKQHIVAALSAGLSCSVAELPEAVSRLQAELTAARREINRYREAELDQEAAELRARESMGVVTGAFDGRSVEELRGLVLRLTGEGGVVALLGRSGDRIQLVFGRPEASSADLKSAFDAALVAIGGGKGGGTRIIQGGSGPGTLEQVERALAAARAVLRP